VGFRWFVRQAALGEGLSGDVRNLPTGCVEIRAQGSKEQLDALERAIQHGPRGARVDGVDVIDEDSESTFDGFEIRI
jgi:acylphosphatase